MKISTKGRYALRMMVDLAVYGREQEYISLRDVAVRQNVSMKYLEQIVSVLVKAGYLKSVRGPAGGYRLARPAEELTVGEVLRVTEGDLHLVPCLKDCPNQCPRQDSCAALPVWGGLREVILEYVDGITLADVVVQTKSLR